MLFVNAKDLPKDFFTRSEREPGYDGYNLATGPQNFASGRVKEFGDWIIHSVLPELRLVNPERFSDEVVETGHVKAEPYEVGNTPMHRDSFMHNKNRTFITIGLNGNGNTSGTIATPYDSYRYRRSDQLTSDELTADFVRPPNFYAAIFDPDTEWHAALADQNTSRRLFKAVFEHKYADVDEVRAAERYPLVCPDNDLFINPMLKFAA
jgi:hypothetical protein